MLTMRDWRPPREIANRSLPRFPERREGRAARRNTAGLLTSRAERHARMAWDDAKRYAINRSMSASVITDGNPRGLLELVMVSALADHLAKCPHCWVTSAYSGEKPGDWITWAAINSRLRDYVVLAGQELIARQGKGRKRSTSAKRA
jgi:hypothetical protein